MDVSSSSDSDPTIKVTHRENRSGPTYLLHQLIKPLNTTLVKAKKTYPTGSPRLEAHKTATKSCDVQERVVEEIYVYDLFPKHAITQNGNASTAEKRRHLYYFAGGGWQMPPSPQHWTMCAELATQLPHVTVSIVSYPLAPNSPAHMAFPQMMKMYKCLLNEAEHEREQVMLAGDSAGGNIVLCLTLAALAENESAPCPIAVLAICPSTDLRRSNPDIHVIQKHDPILRIPFINETARLWRGDWDAEDPRVSPNMADVSPLARRGVQVHGVVGGYDSLSPDAVLFRAKCEKAGVKGEWLDWEKQMHCFPLTWSYGLPEGTEAKDWILDVLRRS